VGRRSELFFLRLRPGRQASRGAATLAYRCLPHPSHALEASAARVIKGTMNEDELLPDG